MKIPQIEVLRKLRDNFIVITDEERAALTDVINHFDACVDCIIQSETAHERDPSPADGAERSDGSRTL